METLFSLIFFLHIFTFLPVSSILSMKWDVASLICLHNSASGIMFRIIKAKIRTRLTTENLETDSAFHICFRNTSGKNHPAFLGKLLGNTCLTYRTAQLNIGSFQGESFGQKLPSTQWNGSSVQHFPVQESLSGALLQNYMDTQESSHLLRHKIWASHNCSVQSALLKS